jgi:hypothetical protein
VKKNFIIYILSLFSFAILFITSPNANAAYAQSECGECEPGYSCQILYEDQNIYSCQPSLQLGNECDVAENQCVGEQVCSPNAPGDPKGTCKKPEEGALCNPDNSESCGPHVTTPYICDKQTSTCKLTTCNPLNGHADCKDRPSFFCIEEANGKAFCKFSSFLPIVGKPPPAPCPEGKYINGRCTAFNTGLGPFSTSTSGFIRSVFGILLAVSGTLALFLIIKAGFKIMTSQGKPESIQEGRDQIIAAIVGLVFLILSLVFLQVIGADLLLIPGFGK